MSFSAGSNANLLARYNNKYSFKEWKQKIEEEDPGTLVLVSKIRADYERDQKMFKGVTPIPLPPMRSYKLVEIEASLQKSQFTFCSPLKIDKKYQAYFQDKFTDKNPEPIYFNSLQFRNSPMDGFLATIAKKTAIDNKQVDTMHLWLRTAANCYFGGGYLDGLLTRLASGLKDPSMKVTAKLLNSTFTMDFCEKFVFEYLQFDSTGPILDLNALETSGYMIPHGSSCGMPVPSMKKGEPGDKLFFELYRSYRSLLETGDNNALASYMENHLDESSVVLQNKIAIHTMDEILQKVRPFFMYPFGISLWFSQLLEELKKGIPDIDKTYWAVGMTYAHRGMRKLYDIIMTIPIGTMRFFAYGDDHLFAFMTSDGKAVIGMLDISAMDLHFLSVWMKTLLRVLFIMLKARSATVGVKTLAQHLVQMAFVPPILIIKSLFGTDYGHLHSGCPGTTEFNTIASGLLHYKFSQEFKYLGGGEESVREYITEFSVFLRKYGFPVKTSTIVVETVPKGDFLSTVTFLGQRICKMGDEVFPKPIPEKLFASLVCHGFRHSDPDDARNICERIIGIVVSGGWTNPLLYNCARDMFNALADKINPNNRDFHVILGHPYNGLTFDLLVDSEGKLVFPSVADIASIYLVAKQVVVETKPKEEKKSFSFKKLSWADVEDEADLDEVELMPKPHVPPVQKGKLPTDPPHSAATDERKVKRLAQKHADRDSRRALANKMRAVRNSKHKFLEKVASSSNSYEVEDSDELDSYYEDVMPSVEEDDYLIYRAAKFKEYLPEDVDLTEYEREMLEEEQLDAMFEHEWDLKFEDGGWHN